MNARVALFTDTFFEVNGAAHTLRKVAETFERRSHALDVYCYDDHSSIEVRGSVRILRFDHRLANNYYEKLHFEVAPDLRIGSHWREAMAAQPYSVVHLATPGSMGLTGRNLALRSGLATVGTYHTHLADYAALRALPPLGNLVASAFWRYMRWFYRPCRSVLGPTQGVVKELQRRGFRNANGIFTRGIDLGLFSASKRKRDGRRTQTAYVGRCAQEKGVMVLPEVTQGIDTDFVVVGDGPIRSELERKLVGTRFTGYLYGEDLAQAYADSDVLLFPSTTDTFGNVVLEAMASGVVPCVAKGPGPSDYVEDGVNAVVCDTPSDMREALRELVSNDAKRNWMRANAAKFATKFDWTRAVDGLIEHYGTALA